MKKKNKIVAIILARKGSKGLKNKNIRLLNSKPLIHYAIEAAKKSKLINKTYVVTDCEKIKKISIENGAEVPFLRNKKYSQDKSTTEEALRNFLDELKSRKKYVPDIIVYLQTTDIFRRINLIDKCIMNLITDKSIDSSFVVTPSHKNYWFVDDDKNLKRLNKGKNKYLPRQKKVPIYREDTGLCLATKNKCITNTKRIGKNVKIVLNTSKIDMIDIHTKNDLNLANLIIKKFKLKPNF
jgi:CMP-N,N'-diacetyllegionaminic acid synthase|tara:strand:- start:235 stop:951 length:717 start_codon:yes stop_codon:yes gene_type:complete